MSDVLLVRDSSVEGLGQALSSGEFGLEMVPKLVVRVLETEAWRDRVSHKSGERFTFSHFEDFVTEKPLAGLGASLDLIKRLVKDDPKAVDLLDRVTASPVGHNNIKGKESRAPEGTSEQYALRRLRKDRPDLHAQVLEREKSAHAAMVEAGFRPRTITIRLEPASIATTLTRHLTSEQIRELVNCLSTN